jgi:DegV family protein with EDD domain
LIPELRVKCTVVPLTVRFGEQEYLDGETIDHITFYEKLAACQELPTTSQASPDTFAQIFQQVKDAGEEAVVVCLSSTFSGTCQSANIAAMDYPDCIRVVDGKSVAIGTGILAQLAVEMAEAGADAETIARRLSAERENVRLVALLDTLEYLKKGGRISKTVAFAGGLLSIKPVVSVQDGAINMLGKARGSKQANNLLVQQIEAAGGVDFDKPVLLGYTGLSDILLEKYIADSSNLWAESKTALQSTPIGSVIGTHAGPGAIAAAFFKKN